jgi:hypothetical protein
MPRADIRIEAIPGGTMISLSGDHDLSTKQALMQALASVPRRAPVLINLERCTFVDSTIISAILAVCGGEASGEPNVSVVLPPDTSYVYRALSVIGLRDLVSAHPSVEAALEALAGPERRAIAASTLAARQRRGVQGALWPAVQHRRHPS